MVLIQCKDSVLWANFLFLNIKIFQAALFNLIIILELKFKNVKFIRLKFKS